MPYAIYLSGPSGSGKSTYARNELPSHFLKLSTDDLILRAAEQQGKKYNEVFESYYPTACELFKQQQQHCHNRHLDYIVDQTNLTEATRKRKLQLVNPQFTKIAIYFPAYTPEVLEKRVNKRTQENGQFVPFEAIKKMHADYKIPQKTEGFDLVVSSSHFIDIMKVMDFK